MQDVFVVYSEGDDMLIGVDDMNSLVEMWRVGWSVDT